MRTKVTDWWRALRPVTRQVLLNLLIGLSIEGCFQSLHKSRILVSIENAATDAIQRVSVRAGGDRRADEPGFTVVDVSEATFERWGRPAVLPRDRLAAIVATALTAGPRLVVFDLVLRPTADPSNDPRRFAAMVDSLVRDRNPNGTASRAAPLLVVQPANRQRGAGCVVLADSISWLDTVDGRGGLRAVKGTALFRRDADFVVRSWVRETRACDGRGITPIPLAVAGMLDRAGAGPPAPERDDRAGVQRIIYQYPWPEVWPSDGDVANRPAVEWIDAGLLDNPRDPVDPEAFRGRVVIVGASFEDGGDIHATPLGEMPGALIIANAIGSLSKYGSMEEAPAWVSIGLLGLLIVAVSVLWARVHHFPALVLSGTVVLLAVIPLSLHFLHRGQWLDFAVPLLAVQIHSYVAQAEDFLHRRIRKATHA